MKFVFRSGVMAVFGLALAACGQLPILQDNFKQMPIERPASEAPAATKERTTAKIHVELGTNYLDTNNLGTALDEAKISVAWDRSYPPSHLLLGKVYASLEQVPEAFAAFQDALNLAPYDPDVNSDYGWFLCNQKREKEGAYRLEQATRNPYFRLQGRALSNLGYCRLKLKDDVGADQAFRAAIAADDTLMRPRFQLAEIALRAGNLPRAREFATDLNRKLQQDTSESLWLQIRIERKLGNDDKVRQMAALLAKQFPTSDEFQLYNQGKFE